MKKKHSAVKKAALGTLAAGSVFLGGLFNSPTELMNEPSAPAGVVSIVPAGDVGGDDVEEEADETRKSPTGMRARLAAFFRAEPPIIKTLLLMPLWAVGKGIAILISGAVSLLGEPVLNVLVGLLLNLLVLAGVFVGGQKLLFPQKKLRDILRPRNLMWMGICAAGLTIADELIPLVWTEYSVWSVVAKSVLGSVVIGFLWMKLFHQKKTSAKAAMKA